MKATRLVIAALVMALWSLASPASPATAAAKGELLARRVGNSLGMEFVLIPDGEFMMGSPPGEPNRRRNERLHKVILTKSFYMQTTEVTLAQWRAVMGARWFFRRKGLPSGPATKVSWFDAQDFIAKLNAMGQGTYRLPTEAEWEYACRAGSSAPYSWGKTIACYNALYANNPEKDNQCMSYIAQRGFKNAGPVPVGSFPANAFGLYDMHGNVWEWCSDWYGRYPKGPVIDPKGPAKGNYRVRRGGSWFRGGRRLRSANRNMANPQSKYATTGFRLVREAR